jgi:hypothetical protein
MPGIEDMSMGQCDSAAMIKGEFAPCDLAIDHNGWAHSNKNLEIIWK